MKGWERGEAIFSERARQQEWNESPKPRHLTIAHRGGWPIRSQGGEDQSQGQVCRRADVSQVVGRTDRLIEGHESRRGREVRTEDGLSIIWRLMVVGTLP